jgi:predicted NBD/HSP70 family sugar kinase
MILNVEGPLCNCGNRGCLEAIGSGFAILREFSLELSNHPEHRFYMKRNSLGIQDVLDAAAESDLLVLHLLNRSAFHTGIAVRNIINMFNPQLVVLGGLLINGYRRYFDIVKDVADSRKMKSSREDVNLLAEPSSEMGIVGAGEIVSDHFFEQVVLRT